MFSPTTRSVRNGMLQNILEIDRPLEPEGDVLEILDPETLDEDDKVAFHELQDLEDIFGVYLSAPYNLSAARFLSGSQEPSSSDPFSILLCLSPTDSETRHISYRLRGLQGLLPPLRAVVCSHPGLIIQRDDLINTVNLELESLLLDLHNERRLHSLAGSSIPGVRSVTIDNHAPNTYASPLVTSAIVLAAIIHALMGVGREHCEFILSSIRAIISMALKMQVQRTSEFLQQHTRNIPSTLSTALHRLNLSPKLDIYACCPKCSRLYPHPTPQAPLPLACMAHNHDGEECNTVLSTTHRRGTTAWQRPIQRYSHMRFETWISELLMRPGMEDLLEAGRPNPHPGSAATDVWDAPYLRTFPDAAHTSFMDAPENELRLAMMLHYDFFNPFGMKTAGKLRSIGCYFMVCLNLHPDVRYNSSNAYLVSMIPGPAEPKLENQPMFVGPIVNDMMELYAPGIWVSRTYKYPHGRRVRAAVVVKSMDILAARGAAGLATHSHTRFCHACDATLDRIDSTDLRPFESRTNVSHREQVALWENAASINDRKKIYDMYGVRSVDWLKFSWWNPTDIIVVGPMHWTKNILEKQLRNNMAWSWTTPAGIPDDAPSSIQPVTQLEYEWGTMVFLCSTESDFKKAGLTAPILHYLCRQRGIFEVGLASSRLIDDLNRWRKTHALIGDDGSRTEYAIEKFGHGEDIGLARTRYYVSRIPAATISTVSQNARVVDLKRLCGEQKIDPSGTKEQLIRNLQASFANVRVPNMPDVAPAIKSTKNAASLLGLEVLTEVRQDMERTTLPSWIKHPPINFATVNHGKLQAEEMKSLALVSFTITLVRLWGQLDSDLNSPLRRRLDHFLHLMVAVRILAFQSITEHDITAFELHYGAYLHGLKSLYPSCTFIPVQHLGLHIPKYLRALGPCTQYSESTCEQFIRMFQNITTNFKFGDLELTLHREFVMASRLKGLFESKPFTEKLGEFGEVVGEFLQQHIPGGDKQTWTAIHSSTPTRVSQP